MSSGGLNDSSLSLLGGISNSPNVTKTPKIEGLHNNALASLEGGFLTYEDLVGLGRIKPGKNKYGLKPGESRYGRDIGALLSAFGEADPTLAAYRKAVMQGIEGLDGPEGLPSDYKRTLLEDLRTSQASRGIIDSDTSAIEEAVRLSGGREAIRAQRLGEVQNYLAGVFNPAVGTVIPSIGQMLQGQMGSYGLNLQRDQTQLGYRIEQQKMATDFAGSAAGVLAFISDRRVKKNVELVAVEDGLNIYEFEYVGSYADSMPGRYRGVMADEVDYIPGAVIHGPDGYDLVDYSRISVKMVRVE